MMRRLLGLFSLVCLLAVPAMAQQQAGSISGHVTLDDRSSIPGVLVEATGDVLPKPAVTTTDANGNFRFPALPPGKYKLTFKLEGMATQARSLDVLLGVNATVDVTMATEAISEEIVVLGQAGLIDPHSSEIKSAVDSTTIQSLPVGQEYRDLQKLIPGVQITENATRGPSAGGSGQDNVYLFDGVNVNLPLFGVLSAEPSSHDIDQVSIVKGGAKAIDFNRSAGLTINTVSKSGTDLFHGEASYQLQTAGMTGSTTSKSVSQADEDRDWAVFNIGGPIVRSKLNFYASYYRPTVARDNGSNAYGSVPKFDSTRDEFFGRLSYQPTDSILIHGSYRDSDRSTENASIGPFATASTSLGDEVTLKIGILEGSWMNGENGYATFKFTDFKNENGSRPDNLLGLTPATDGSVSLNVNDLASQGLFVVPNPIAGEDAFNAWIDPLIQTYGYLEGGVRKGGGEVGVGATINNQDFFRKSYQLGYNFYFGQQVAHELHLGAQKYKDSEDLDRRSNGWGVISAPGGRVLDANSNPIFYQAVLWQQGVRGESGDLIPKIHSEFKSTNVEINDTIRWNDWTFNVGAVLSDDKLYGQGLRKNSATVSGFELCISCKYEMYHVKFKDQIQPRLGAVWSYDGRNTVFANYARYNPAASSLPRAASWARNLGGAILEANFDASGNLISSNQRASSSGKFFVPDMDPRYADEWLVGTSRQISPQWTARVTARYRESRNFWEDTNNNARQFGNAPDTVPHDLYIPELDSYRAEVGGSSYVIAELDNGFTKYYEASVEAEWRSANAFFRGSYVWSHYYGNFDQDDTASSPINNDQAIFIGSSNIADGPGRQLWDMKYGDLHGDRRHQVKLYGYYSLPWDASVGGLAFFQSGEPWEAWDVEVYRAYTSSASNTIRFAEPAGSRTTPDHYQVDLNYSQNFHFGGRYTVTLTADLYNVFDKQTGYGFQPNVHAANFGEPTRFINPRRLQLGAKIRF